MKIAFLHSANDVYGASRVLADDVARLAAEGHHVNVVVPGDGPLSALREVIGDGYVVDERMSIIRRINPRDAARSPRLPVAAQLADVVVLWTLSSALYAPMLRARRRAHVVSVHERRDGLSGRALLALGLGHRTPTQVNSEWVKEWVRERVAEDRVVLSYPSVNWMTTRNSVDADDSGRPAEFSANRPMKMLLIGRVNGRKGHLLAVKVAEKLNQGGRYVHLTLAGAPYPGQEPHLHELQALVRRCHDFVSFVGEVESMRSVAGGQDLLLMLPTQPEPFGITPLEAWQCGLPVLGIPTGGAAESLALVDGMITEDDFPAIVDDVARLYDDPRGAWRHPPNVVSGQVICAGRNRTNGWKLLLEMAVRDAR